jgi:glycosyltransferase involved in cell wall biosynthesis
MTGKRLLFVSPRFIFPSDSGGKIRTRDVLRGMKGGRFEITLVSPEPPGGAERFAEDLRCVCDHFVGWPEAVHDFAWNLRRHLSVASSLPISVASDRSKAGRAVIDVELQRRPDVIVADFPHASVLLPDQVSGASVLFTHNVEAEIFKRHAEVAAGPVLRALWLSQERKMKGFEDDAARRYDALVAVSARDADYFRAISRAGQVFTIPTGVDLEYFAYKQPRVDVQHDGGTIVFTGSMNWLANVDGIRFFMDQAWPRIAEARPAARMVVVGHSPPKELVQAVKDKGLGWTFTGFVDDVRVHVNAADAFIIPLRVGGGTRIKAFEAMAMGCPVASTAIGVEGLPVVPGEHCVIGDSGDALADAVLRLLGDPATRQSISRNARRLVAERYSFRAAAAAFEDACLTTLAAKRRAPASFIPQTLTA